SNLLHSSFFLTFLIALSIGRVKHSGEVLQFTDHALSLWHVIQSDSVQRELAFNAISTVRSEKSLTRAVKRIKWALKQAADLGRARNIVAHSPVTFRAEIGDTGFELVPGFGGFGGRVQHANMLKEIEGLSLWKQVRDDLLKLHTYVSELNIQTLNLAGLIVMEMPLVWPRRPLLRSVPRLREIDARLKQEAQQTVRRTRRRPSRRYRSA
ncbi:MAG: hypothetical protein ACTHLR_02425, partial [Rhizomicrobium sp.]